MDIEELQSDLSTPAENGITLQRHACKHGKKEFHTSRGLLQHNRHCSGAVTIENGDEMHWRSLYQMITLHKCVVCMRAFETVEGAKQHVLLSHPDKLQELKLNSAPSENRTRGANWGSRKVLL
uniref:C2H2-type domain-containing protein n=1 Tax=Amorphochlora amoebiformis TaxID=1561963 RepID=A0A7S0DDH7_9EUKA